MELSTKPDCNECLARIDAWFAQAIVDRPPVRFCYNDGPHTAAGAVDTQRWASLEQRWFDVDYQIEMFERSLVGRAFYAETFPVFWPNLGPSAYAAFYGGRLQFDTRTSWFEPVIAQLEDLSPLAHDPFTSVYFRKLEELTVRALERCGRQYLVGYPDVHPSLDCAAAWRGITALCLDMASAPAQLAPLLELSVRDFHRVFAHFNRLVRAHGLPSITWLGIPSFDAQHIPSCDVSAMISTEHFVQYSLPLLERETAGMARNIYYVDGPGVARHLEVLLALPEIHAMYWVPGLGPDAPILQWIPLLKRIQAAGKSVIVDLGPDELDEFMAAIRPEGVMPFLNVSAGQEPEIMRRITRWR